MHLLWFWCQYFVFFTQLRVKTVSALPRCLVGHYFTINWYSLLNMCPFCFQILHLLIKNSAIRLFLSFIFYIFSFLYVTTSKILGLRLGCGFCYYYFLWSSQYMDENHKFTTRGNCSLAYKWELKIIVSPSFTPESNKRT